MTSTTEMEKPSILKRGDSSVVRKSGSKYLYYDFPYLGVRVTISTGLNDTPENREKARAWLRGKMQRGSFRFCEAFPMASPRLLALFAAKEETAIKPVTMPSV